jgi:hypothetical protein
VSGLRKCVVENSGRDFVSAGGMCAQMMWVRLWYCLMLIPTFGVQKPAPVSLSSNFSSM